MANLKKQSETLLSSTDLGEFRVRFVDGVRCCVDGVSEFLLQKPVGFCCLTNPVVGKGGEACHSPHLNNVIPQNPSCAIEKHNS